MFHSKLINVLILIIGFSITSTAQKLEFGPEIGTNVLSIDEDNLGAKYLPNFHAGAIVIYSFNEYWSVKSGVFFTQKSHYYSESDTSKLSLFGLEDQIDQIENLNLDVYSFMNSRTSQYYLELPILGTFNYKKFNVSLGGYANYMLYSRTKKEEITEVPLLQVIDIKSLDPTGLLSNFLPEPYSYSLNENATAIGLANWDFGLRFGLGMEIDHIGINAYYNLGLSNYRSQLTTRYNYAQLSLNYKFSLK